MKSRVFLRFGARWKFNSLISTSESDSQSVPALHSFSQDAGAYCDALLDARERRYAMEYVEMLQDRVQVSRSYLDRRSRSSHGMRS